MKFFLQLKHWQLFTLLFGFTFIFEIVMVLSDTLPQRTEANIPQLIIAIIYVGVLFNWFYALGMHLNKKIPMEVRLNARRFQLLFYIPAVYFLFIFLCMGLFSLDPLQILFELPTTSENSLLFLLFHFLHLIAMCSIFYCIYFIAKSLKTVELQKEVEFKNFAKEFFCMWCFPIGIWFIQPRINKLFAKDKTDNSYRYTNQPGS